MLATATDRQDDKDKMDISWYEAIPLEKGEWRVSAV